jgi:hypothetical protein
MPNRKIICTPARWVSARGASDNMGPFFPSAIFAVAAVFIWITFLVYFERSREVNYDPHAHPISQTKQV